MNRLRLYASVGAVLTRWEEIELRLIMLYTIFGGGNLANLDLSELADFEKAVGPSGRLDLCDQAAQRFFVSYCNQDDKGSIMKIFGQTRLFCLRRNDIAHGAVRKIRYTRSGGVIDTISVKSGGSLDCGFFLVPISQLRKRVGEVSKPTSAYNSREIYYYADQIQFLRFARDGIIEKLRAVSKSS